MMKYLEWCDTGTRADIHHSWYDSTRDMTEHASCDIMQDVAVIPVPELYEIPVPGMLTPPLVPRGTRLKEVISQGSPLENKGQEQETF